MPKLIGIQQNKMSFKIENQKVKENFYPFTTLNILNIKNKDDLITVDLRLKQIRYLTKPEQHGNIEFMELSNDDVAGYDYLFRNDKKLFFSSLKEDMRNFLGKNIKTKDLKVIQK